MAALTLTDRSVLKISGADADNFLQGLISNDINKLKSDNLLYAAILTPQGKFLYDFFLCRRDDSILLDAASARIDEIAALLKKYMLRRNVALEKTPYHVAACLDATPPEIEKIKWLPDPRHNGMGWRAITENAINGSADYEHKRISLAIPDSIKDMEFEKTLLLEARFDEINGVDFNKGCYVGQEITTRSKFRGNIRRKIIGIKSEKPLPTHGAEILADGEIVGHILSTSGNIGMAIIKLEALDKNLTASGIALKPHML